jgi:hypothetical protein
MGILALDGIKTLLILSPISFSLFPAQNGETMVRLRYLKSAVLLVAVVSIFGCKSKQESPAATSAAPTQKPPEAIKAISGQAASGTVAASPQDKTDAEAAATRVLAQMEAGEFSTMYKESAPTFKQIGPEAAFVAKFQQTRQNVGALKNPKQTSFVSRPDQTFVLVYRAENERVTSERRLTFVRSNSGKMELFGLNQHDEPKKQAAK